MTLIRKLASALYLALLFTNCSNAQVDSSTGNLINFTGTPTTTTSNWNNGVYVNQLGCFGGNTPGNCGPYPNVQTNGNINFSYGQVDLNQVVNINRALAAGGSGVQLSGFNFSFLAKNGNGWDNGQQDYLSAYVRFYNNTGGLAANYDYTSQTNQRYNWTQFSFSETFANPSAATNYSNAQVGFVGRDTNYWAGPYGPEINNVSFSLKYRVDPCALNPAYSPNCSEFNTVATSNNLVPNRDGYAVFGDSINQSFAINTALANAGSAAQIHGFQWGYTANANGPYCAFWILVCFDERTPKVQTHVNITDSGGASLYSVSRNYENSYNNTNYSYLFPASKPMSTLGNFNFSATAYDSAYVGNMYSRALFTADPCAVNPLSSPTCSGYGAAYAKTLTSSSTASTATSPAPALAPPALADAAPALASPIPDPTQPQQASAPAAPPPPAPAPDATQSVAQADPAQPSPTQAGPASTSPQPAGGPPQATQTASSSSSSGPSASSAGPSKLAMSVLKSAQEKDKATQNAAVQAAAKTLEGSMQSSQASSNLAISLNQDMSANSAVAAAAFASQTTQASQQTATQSSQGPQQTAQASTQTTTQSSKLSSQEQQSQQETQQTQVQSSANDVQYQPPKQQETQQAQSQSSTSVVKLMPPVQQETQQAQSQSTSVVQYQAPQQQEQQQAQSQSSSSVVKLLPPQQQEQQQTQTQMTAGMMTLPQSTYTPLQQTQDTQSTQVTALKPPTPPVVEVQQQASSGTGLTVSRNMFAYNPLMSSNSSSQSLLQQQPQPVFQQRLDQKQFEVEAPQMPIASFSGSRAGNPLSEIMMQQRFEMMQNNISQPASAVNRNVQPNELAGKVDIASMASVPAGFNAYSIVLKDAAFYEPKEVYKNQKTVDNERVLRGLTRGSDSLHQQMVDQQYKIGN